MDFDLKSMGKRIQNRRKQRGYTQEQLAELMNVSVQMVSNLERGIKAIRIDNLIKLSNVLDTSTDYFLTGKQNVDDAEALTLMISQLSDRDRQMILNIVEYCSSEKG